MENIELILLIVIVALLIILLIIVIIPTVTKKYKRKQHPKLFEILGELSDKMDVLLDYAEKADNYDELVNEFNKTQKQIAQLETEHINISKEKIKLQKEFEEKSKAISEKIQSIERQSNTNKELLIKVRKAEHLKDYAEKVFVYLQFIESIVDTANNYCIEYGKKNEDTAKVMLILLLQALEKTKTMAKWEQICGDIQEKEIVVLNSTLKNCFQSDRETEQLKAFKTKCISELKDYTNAILILCEAYSNLSMFSENSNGDASSLEDEFKNEIAEINNRAKTIGITEITDVKIFTKIDDNKGAEATYGQILFPYSIVKNLKKDDVAQIISFGMKTEFEDNISKTKVLTR